MRIGVYICHCGLNIARTINVDDVRKFAEKQADVVVARDIDYLCSDSSQNQIKDDIKEYNLDRVVIASCSPRMHEETFRKCVKSAGLNPYHLEIANIREQCSWVHDDELKATDKAKDLLKMAIAKVRYSKPLDEKKVPINRNVLVVGGGIAGIHAALELAKAGITVFMVEKRPTIGGKMALLNVVFPTNDCSICVLAPKMSEVSANDNIKLFSYSEITSIEGRIGDFKVKIKKKPRYIDEDKCKGCIDDCSGVCPVDIPNEYDFNVGKRKAIYIPIPQSVPNIAVIDPENCTGCRFCEEGCGADAIDFSQREEEIELNVGTMIVATGYQPFDASKKDEYGYGKFKNVFTTFEVERLLNASGPTKGILAKVSDGKIPKKIAFIQCVGSRDKKVGRPYCSKVCCMVSIKNANIIKNRYPDTDITIFYTDIRAGGPEYEEYYEKTQKMGVKFVRGNVGEIYEKNNGDLVLSYEDTLECMRKDEEFEMVALSVGMEQDQSARELGRFLGLTENPDGFFSVIHPKMRPVDANIEGVFIAGCATGPKEIPDAIVQGLAAASKVMSILNKGEVGLDPMRASLIEDRCDGCSLCIDVCKFNNITMDKDRKKAVIDETGCHGCGSCVAACPNDAISLPNFSDDQIINQIDAALDDKKEYPMIIAFFCNWCCYAAADLAGAQKISYPSNVRIIRVICSAMVKPEYILRAFEKGADGVMVGGCRLGECHYKFGNYDADKRLSILREVLAGIGIDGERLKTVWRAASEGDNISNDISDFTQELLSLGPLGFEFSSLSPDILKNNKTNV